jgi:anti-sigma-K factor RskA
MTMQPEVHTLTGAYVCDALDDAERAAFEEHLSACPECTQEVAELREVTALLGVAAAAEPPRRLKEAVDARIRVTRQQPRTVVPITRAPSVRRRNRAAWTGWAAAAVLACVVAGQTVYSVHQSHQLTSASQQTSALTQLLSATDARSNTGRVSTGGHAIVVDSRSRDEAATALSGLPPLPAGKVYQLWMIGAAGARSAGVLPTPTGGAEGPVIAHGLGDATTVGLTVEPAGGSAQPTTTPILLLAMA